MAAEELKVITTAAILPWLDLLGTFVFAISGAVAGVRRRLDLFGVLVLSFAASSAGGIIRDLLIGSLPPVSINDWRIVTAATLAGLLVFIFSPRSPGSGRRQRIIVVFDAAGLALFAVTGTQKALDYGLSPVTAPLLGMLSGIGGGMVRDLLVTETPAVLLRGELYAVAALAGAATVVIGHGLSISTTASAIAGAAICFTIRIFAIRRGWTLPVAKTHDTDGSSEILANEPLEPPEFKQKNGRH